MRILFCLVNYGWKRFCSFAGAVSYAFVAYRGMRADHKRYLAWVTDSSPSAQTGVNEVHP